MPTYQVKVTMSPRGRGVLGSGRMELTLTQEEAMNLMVNNLRIEKKWARKWLAREDSGQGPVEASLSGLVYVRLEIEAAP